MITWRTPWCSEICKLISLHTSVERGRNDSGHQWAAVCQSALSLWERASLHQHSKWPQFSCLSNPDTIFLMHIHWFLLHLRDVPSTYRPPALLPHTQFPCVSVSPTHSFIRPSSESNLCSPTFPSFFSLFHSLFPSSKMLSRSIVPFLCYFVTSFLFIPKLGFWAVKREDSMIFCTMNVEHRAYSWIHV